MTIKVASLAASMALAVALVAPANAASDAQKYQFELVENDLKLSPQATVSLRLLNTASGQPVNGAVVFATRMDMEPEQMETMTSPVVPVAPVEGGIYRFRISPAMAGSWRFSIAAKVQGETETVTSRLVVRIVE